MRPLAGGPLLAVVVAVLFFTGLGAYPLLDPDEGRHAEVAREMAAGPGVRALFLPTLELQPYREKPAGFYWLVTLAYGALGVSEAAARLPSAVAAFVAVLAVYAWALPRHGPYGALGAALVLATSVGWMGLARFVNVDMTLTACVAIGVLAGLAWLERPEGRRMPLVPWVAAGLGTLVKGPIAVVLTLGPLALGWVLAPPPRPRLGAGRLLLGVTTTTAIAAALFVPVALLDPSYVRHFAGTNVARFGPDAPHAAPIWYYAAWLPALFLPWTLFAPGVLGRAIRGPSGRALLAWAAFVPAVMTLASGKLATYVLSALVPLALLVGPPLARAAIGEGDGGERALRIAGWLGSLILAAGAVGVVVAARFFPVGALGAAGLAATMAVAAVTLASTTRRRAGLAPAVAVAAMLVVYPALVHVVAPAVARVQSDRDAAALIAAGGPAPVLAFSALAPSMVFYLRAPVIWTEDTDLVRDLFARDEPVFLVTGRRHFARIESLLGERAHVWHETRRRRLYGNRPPAVDGGSR